MSKAVLALYRNPSYGWWQTVLLIATFWPVWQWYFERLADPSDEPLGIVAVLTLLALGMYKYHSTENKFSNFKLQTASNLASTLSIVAALLCVYCAVITVAPKIFTALLALAVCAVLLHRLLPLSLSAGDFALLALSLPIVASFNYYLGYPMRMLACQMASLMLNLGGLAVNAQGTEILSNNSIVGIDPPCSGIKMLWVALYLAATCASLRGLRTTQTLKLLAMSVFAAVVANALRVSSLFYVESGLIPVSGIWHTLVHSGVGVAIFALSAAALVKVAYTLPIPTSSAEPQNQVSAGIDSRSPKHISVVVCSVVALCILAALLPLAFNHSSAEVADKNFAGWPNQFEGENLAPIKLSQVTEKFAKEFPGKIAVFTTGKSRVVYRWVTQPTLQLHPSANCYKGSGYDIKWLPEYIDADDTKWSAFQASKGSEKLLVHERIFDTDGQSWTDVSSWYWAAVLKQSKTPWWAISSAERIE